MGLKRMLSAARASQAAPGQPVKLGGLLGPGHVLPAQPARPLVNTPYSFSPGRWHFCGVMVVRDSQHAQHFHVRSLKLVLSGRKAKLVCFFR